MNDIENMMYDCFPLFAKGYEVGEHDGREQMAQTILNFINYKSPLGKCELTVDVVLELYNSLK